jgi:hypothetical protein
LSSVLSADPKRIRDKVAQAKSVFSSALLTALGALLGAYAPLYFVMLCVILARRFQAHTRPPDEHLTSQLLTILGAAVLGYLCFRAGSALKQGRRWAAYVAIGWGFLLVYFGSRVMIDLFRPYQPGAVHGEDFFVFLVAVPCLLVGVWWCVYLNLPRVRKLIQTVENGHLELRSGPGDEPP